MFYSFVRNKYFDTQNLKYKFIIHLLFFVIFLKFSSEKKNEFVIFPPHIRVFDVNVIRRYVEEWHGKAFHIRYFDSIVGIFSVKLSEN